MAVDMEEFELEKIRAEIHQERQMKEMLEQSAAELRATVQELEKRYDSIDNEDESISTDDQNKNDNNSNHGNSGNIDGNEWKTRFETQQEINTQLERQILNLQNKVQEARSNLKDGKQKRNKIEATQKDPNHKNSVKSKKEFSTKKPEHNKMEENAKSTKDNLSKGKKCEHEHKVHTKVSERVIKGKLITVKESGAKRKAVTSSEDKVVTQSKTETGGKMGKEDQNTSKKMKLQTKEMKSDKSQTNIETRATQTLLVQRNLQKKNTEQKINSPRKTMPEADKASNRPRTIMVMHKAIQVNLETDDHISNDDDKKMTDLDKTDDDETLAFDKNLNPKRFRIRTKPGSYLRARAIVTGRDLTSRSSGQASMSGSSKSYTKPDTALTKSTGITINIAISPRTEGAGKTPRDLRSFDDLSDANPHMIRLMEKEKNVLSNQLRDLEWRLDQESKAYHKANDERKTYSLEINATKGSITELSSRSKQPLTARDVDTLPGSRMSRAMGSRVSLNEDEYYSSPNQSPRRQPIKTIRTTNFRNLRALENEIRNIPEDQRILDPKRGPIRKTAGIKNLPSLETT